MIDVYVIKAIGGQWEDAWEKEVLVVKTRERAQLLCKEYQEAANEYYDMVQYYKDNPDQLPSHLNDMAPFKDCECDEDEVFCSQGCIACDVDDFFPSDDHPTYIFFKVKMED